MMALQVRHGYMAARIAEAFGIDNNEAIGAVLREQLKINDFLMPSSPSSPSHLLVYYQPRDVKIDEDGFQQGTGRPELFFTSGAEDKLRNKAIFFVRNAPSVNVEIENDGTLLFGEISKDPLANLELSLRDVFVKHATERVDWGKASSSLQDEFKTEITKVTTNISETMRSFGGGLELSAIDPSISLDEVLQTVTARTKSKKSSGEVPHVSSLKTLLELWCSQIDKYLNDVESVEPPANSKGPLGILEFWRTRMQRLTSVTEQLRRKDVKSVIQILTTVTKGPPEGNVPVLFTLIRKWKDIDMNVTEATNEAKDNVKYLTTLEKFVEPLYTGTPMAVIDTLPALMNSIKMIHTIARYFNTPTKMTDLFVKVTHRMIENCKTYITTTGSGADETTSSDLWSMNLTQLIARLESCLKLNEIYQETYRLTKEKLAINPKGKQFDLNEQAIFGRFDLFCRRAIKLIDLFSTIQQFRTLASHRLEGMDALTSEFEGLARDLKARGHDLLAFSSNNFDRDFVEFHVNIDALEVKLQQFINNSFEQSQPINDALNLLEKFKNVLQRESLRADLDDKVAIIFQSFGNELEEVQNIYEEEKQQPLYPRNLPPVAGAITWARHLLSRIEGPMKRFEAYPSVFLSRDGKRIVKLYNRVARTLVAFEYVWFNNWVESIEAAKAGLQATLIIRHPQDGKLYVNFDAEILQLIREAKCLDMMGIAIPESAKVVLLQEEKFKAYFTDLTFALREYARIASKVIPVVSPLLRPTLYDMEYRLRPGMITLTWTSMNIDAYKAHIHAGLRRLEELIRIVNDIVENRIEKNLRFVSKSMLVYLPPDRSFTLDEFVMTQQDHVHELAQILQGKNMEVEAAVLDLIELIKRTPLDPHIEPVSDADCAMLRSHYNSYMYTALLGCAKNSLSALKSRVSARAASSFISIERPFFELNVQLINNDVLLTPSLEEVQGAINKCATAILGCSKRLYEWDQHGIPEEERESFFTRITSDAEIVCVVLLLTGSIRGTSVQVMEFLKTFDAFKELWEGDADLKYKAFASTSPTIDDYEQELLDFSRVDERIQTIAPLHVLGALALNTTPIKQILKQLNSHRRVQYSENLHRSAFALLSSLTERFKSTLNRLSHPAETLDNVRYLMDVLKDVREWESSIDMQLKPVNDMYSLLDMFHQDSNMSKEEMDMRATLNSNWMRLRDRAEEVTETIAKEQSSMRITLTESIKTFKVDVLAFRNDFVKKGPMREGISASEAQDLLRKFEGEFAINARRREIFSSGELLFDLPKTEYPELDETEKELTLLAKLYNLYRDVMLKMEEWGSISWTDVPQVIDTMSSETESFISRCTKMPKKLREWQAFTVLKKKIEDFQAVLPLLQELSKDSICPRHWADVKALACEPDSKLDIETLNFTLNDLLKAKLVEKAEEIKDITMGADKEADIELKLNELESKWATQEFVLQPWKNRGINILVGVGAVVEMLEESQSNLQTILTMRYVGFFRERAQALLKTLSDTSETLEKWQKVQVLWCSLESVLTTGDIAKQMPADAKRFAKVDKDFSNIMGRVRVEDHSNTVVGACSNEILVNQLPIMLVELENGQKQLEGYLEQKRNKFPRFYFVSNPVLLQMLSQGSDPLSIRPYYEKIFDSISTVEHSSKDKFDITAMISREGRSEERIPFLKAVKAQGNIEDWLALVLREMRLTLKARLDDAASEVFSVGENKSGELRRFNDNTCGQFALLGIQLLWTAECESALARAKKEKTAMASLRNYMENIFQTLCSWCLEDLGSSLNRVKVETLVTIHAHQRDVIDDLRRVKVSAPDDFEWLKQARFYWDPSGEDFLNDSGVCQVKVTDVVFDYQYEYLGCKERLVVTPLTDRCYITLAQALNMYFGGAPAGPAGTGKTETTKDMGRALGIFVVVTNCTDQMRYTDCAKIFKGLCQAGLWGCFDEFNRITLPVLSVVAQQVLAITNAKRNNVEYFQFPGDTSQVLLNQVCGFFITMNPGYAGRQELPENLKALFRGVAMMVPDRELIMRVKLSSVGYSDATNLAHKFFVCYALCEQQLSKQKHYDFGLRNILSVLRSAGATKRKSLQENEEVLLYRTLRDMNESKFVAQDTLLFKSMLKDLFANQRSAPAKQEYPEMMGAIARIVAQNRLVLHDSWVVKVIQLYETSLVRHGIMLTGPTGGGKSRIIETLNMALGDLEKRALEQNKDADRKTRKIVRLNPKAVLAHELYGQTDPVSGEWVKGVFASIWEKANSRDSMSLTWIVEDGPVDAIWIEDLNTVLDDNKILTLASGDRILMTDNVKIMFENESLANASPATVSRAGIIYVSESDLDWAPVLEAWINQNFSSRPELQSLLRSLFLRLLGENKQGQIGHMFEKLTRDIPQVMKISRVGAVSSMYSFLAVLLKRFADGIAPPADKDAFERHIERLILFALAWSVGGLLEPAARSLFDEYLRTVSKEMPPHTDDRTIYEYSLSPSLQWISWSTPVWTYPNQEVLDFSNLLVPTMDSTRAIYVLQALHDDRKPVLLLGGPGTAKTSTALMFFSTFDVANRKLKRINFSSATQPVMFQEAVESELDKRGGRSFGPPGNKVMTVFIDDVSMPLVNTWGDQPTNEIVRQLIEQSGFYFLEKDKRGEFKTCEDLQFVAAMNHPGGGRNDIPNRLKRQFFSFNLVLPSLTSIDDLYGQMLKGRFTAAEFSKECLAVSSRLTSATINVWEKVKNRMLPTPTKFHYIFNMRELSRVFQGILLTPKASIRTGGSQEPSNDDAATLVKLWRHELSRVFEDKLASNEDKAWFEKTAAEATAQFFPTYASQATGDVIFADFFRDDVYDEDEVLVELAPKIYEPAGTLANVRARVQQFMAKHNEENPSRTLELVLFDDALHHLLHISRILATPRGSALLVGVGGSGKQSLTRLAAYIARSKIFQIALTKGYNLNALKEDLKSIFDTAGHLRKSITFIFTESEIKDEYFLEYINSVLMTGEVAGLFAKDEMMAMTADLSYAFTKERPGLPETQDNLKQFFIDCARDNLHVVLCMSPVNPKFPERARKFPGLISGTTIDWFLVWPEAALMEVSRGFLSNFNLEAEPAVKEQLMSHMGTVHNLVVQVCHEYFATARRHVYQTPKSYLSFIASYMKLYADKLRELQVKESNINRGLEKLISGAEGVEKMKIVLKKDQIALDKATEETNAMLLVLQAEQAEADKESAAVSVIKESCMAESERIQLESSICKADLAKAQPILDYAQAAANSIEEKDVRAVSAIANPADGVKLSLEGVLILMRCPIAPPSACAFSINKKQFEFITPSLEQAKAMVINTSAFLDSVNNYPKDRMNPEIAELVYAYQNPIDLFTIEDITKAFSGGAGLFKWAGAMPMYYEASCIVLPKIAALQQAEQSLKVAMANLAVAEENEAAVKAKVQALRDKFDYQTAEKMKLEANAAATKERLEQASYLISSLADEKSRWSEDSRHFAESKRRLLGDCAVACAFVSYCGPFNTQYRTMLIQEKFARDCRQRGVPVSKDLDVISFLVDVGVIGDWNMQGLPTDPLSIQNGILVTRSARYPLLIDPQGQALAWLKKRFSDTRSRDVTISLSHKNLKDTLQFSMEEGMPLIVVGVEEELDPILDPVLERQVITRGRKKFIKLADTDVELHPDFSLYFITRLPNPHFSPELQAKTTVVDFTVTMKGLEEQLLGRVIAREQNALEKLLNQVLGEVNSNTKSLLDLDAQLLERLSNGGDLLEDKELIGVLNNTKSKAAEVKTKLADADETKRSIGEKREQFRPVATRGSVLYFSIVDMSLVNAMYQTSLTQFIELFMKAMDMAEKASLASKRVQSIIETLTYIVYRYINKGLYERDKLLFVLNMAVKILMSAGILDASEVSLFLRGGAALSILNVRRKPLWISDEAWLNVIALSESIPFFKSLPDSILRRETDWRLWYDDNEPEQREVPELQSSLSENKDSGPWRKLLLIRSMRLDRTLLSVSHFVRDTEGLGPRYVEPVTDTIESIFDGMTPYDPVIFLLSTGSDPTDSIEHLAKRKKTAVQCVSLGEGQEPVAMHALNVASVNGTWVLLQNCELSLELMDKMEDILHQMRANGVHADFRLFITALPHPKFPLGLLQMSTKVTNEPPNGMKASLLRSYTVMVDQDRIERIDSKLWRRLVFTTCFLHSVAQERRKFGPLGWCIPYEYGDGDLSASLLFIEKHLYQGLTSWPTIQYMIAEVQYGGKITDNMDRRLFNAYTAEWITAAVENDDFNFCHLPNFTYSIPSSVDVNEVRAEIAKFPAIDSPEIYGLHPNADLTFRVKEVNALISTMSETLPKTGGGGSGRSLEDVVNEKARQLLEQLPPDYIEEDVRARINSFKGRMENPMNVFLYQEVQRLQAVISSVRQTLKQMISAIAGEVVMTSELLQAMQDIFDAKVPRPWLFTPGGDEFSWLIPYLGAWFLGLDQRAKELTSWLNDGRPAVFWMTGFSNPQGFLTSMKQEVTQQHNAPLMNSNNADKTVWSLDLVEYDCTVLEKADPDYYRRQREAQPDKAEDGVLIHGLFLDGAAWDSHHQRLTESEPKKLFAVLPVIRVTAKGPNSAADKGGKRGQGDDKYEAPCYRYPARTDRYRIFQIPLKCEKGKARFWTLGGVAVLCMTS